MTQVLDDWLLPSSFEQAAQVQRLLAQKVTVEDQIDFVKHIAGVDVSNSLASPDWIYAACVAVDAQTLCEVERSASCQPQALPYKTGFLAFREVPAIIEAWRKLKNKPQLVMVDGHGISHPRRLGIASHLGVLLNVPTIGVAKTLLVGKLAQDLGPYPGDRVNVTWKGQVIAIALRTRLRSNPLIIAPGHRISLETAVKWVLKCLRGYRLPMPTRLAHQAANQFRVELSANSESSEKRLSSSDRKNASKLAQEVYEIDP